MLVIDIPRSSLLWPEVLYWWQAGEAELSGGAPAGNALHQRVCDKFCPGVFLSSCVCGCFPGGAGGNVATVMLCAGVLPALEQLFRQLPVVSPAHVTATVLLVSLGE